MVVAVDGAGRAQKDTLSSLAGIAVVGCGLSILPQPSWAGNNTLPSDAAVLFDYPSARQEIAAALGPHPTDALTCTWYADLMIRETGTDSSGPGPAFIVRQDEAGSRPACVAAHGERSLKLDTTAFSFLGRKGPFLFFDATDPQGASAFFVLRAPDGRRVYADDYEPAGEGSFRSVDDADGILRLGYTRGYNGSCSVLKGGAECWSKMMKDGHFARAIASQPPPLAACAAAYRAAKVPEDDSNIITYDVDLTLTVEGKATVLHRGAIGCEPAP